MNTPEYTHLLGPLEPLWQDPDVVEIMADGPAHVYVERFSRPGHFEDVSVAFRDDEHLLTVVNAVLAPLGHRLEPLTPFVDARLPDGARLNVVMPPIAILGPALTMRRFKGTPLTVEDLLGYGCWSEDMVAFLRACVLARLNVVVAGGTASGKTTVLNILAGMIPDDERVIAIQNVDELHIAKKYLVKLDSRPPDKEGRGEVTIQDLVRNSLRMRPDRIVLGECRGTEALDILHAMNTGHEGTLMTVHATSPHDVLARLEMLVTFANLSIPLLTIRQMMASAIHLITYQELLSDGTRKVLKVTEVAGMQGDVVALRDVFEFRQTGMEDGRIVGQHTATGHVPGFLDRIRAAGADLPASLFEPRR